MPNSQVFTSVSGNNVTIVVKIDPTDITLTGTDRWAVLISSKTDHGLGSTGTPDFPYYVDYVKGNGNYTFTRTLITDKYVAELALVGEGVVDYSLFDITIIVPPVTSILNTINIAPSATVEIGDSITLPVTCKDQNGSNMPCPSLRWESSTTNVTVDNNGNVTTISVGTVSITCRDVITGIVSNICSVTIIPRSCTNPKYKCFKGTCISDNCDDSGIFTNANCDNTCMDITNLVISQDFLTKPYMRTAGVSGTGTGTFTIKEGSNVVASGTMTNGWGLVDINNISAGNHTYCVTPSSANVCDTFTVDAANTLNVINIVISFDNLTKPYMRTAGISGTGSGTFQIVENNTTVATGTMTNGWGLVDINNISPGTHTYCALPSTTIVCQTFTVEASITPPVTPPGCTNPKYKWVGGICASDDCDGTGTYTDSACTSGGGGGTATGVLASITIDETASVQVGKTVTLTSTCKDANGNIGTCPDLVWQSDNESIAKVSAGVITGVGAGTANILVKDGATSQIISNTAVVTVKESINLSDWLQTETCLDSTNKKYCAKNWMFGAAGVTALILLTRKKQ